VLRRIAVAVVVVGCLGFCVIGQLGEQPLEELALEIRSGLDAQSLACEFSGVVLLAHEGIPFYQAAYGMADRGAGLPNRLDTKFNLGSMDKMFTSIAIMQLRDRGLLDLDDPIDEYLPDLPIVGAEQCPTVRQLLSHQAGFGNYFEHPDYLDAHTGIRSLDDYCALIAGEPLLFEPGTDFGYSNSGFIVLGLIVEAVSGVSYYDYVLDRIHRPTGMYDTDCYEWDRCVPNLAVGYTSRDWDGNDTDEIIRNELVLPTKGGSAGGGYSTAPDLLAFANALMAYELLRPESTEYMLEGKVELFPGLAYAYGFFDRVVEGHRMVGHGGGFQGICCMLSIYPEIDLTVIILSNTDRGCTNANGPILEILLK